MYVYMYVHMSVMIKKVNICICMHVWVYTYISKLLFLYSELQHQKKYAFEERVALFVQS